LRIVETKTDSRAGIQSGGSLKVEVTLQLGQLSPNDLSVDIYYGRVDSKADFLDRSTLTLRDITQKGNQTVFRGEVPCQDVGRFGFRVRILPSHPLLSNPYSLGLILWG
jgi:starch phosphorylase